MKLNPSEFISKAEGLKSWEINTRQKLESIRSERLSIQSQIETLEYRLDSLYLELESLQDDEDEETDNSAAIASVRAEISATQEEISDYEAQDAELSIEESETEEELRQIELEEQETLADIQDSASRTKNNIVLISSFGGDYANVSAQATSSFQHNLGQLSQAAQILGGSVSMGAIGNSGGYGGSSTIQSNQSQSGRNFYEAANNQRKNGSTNTGSFGSKSSSAKSSGRTERNLYGSDSPDNENNHSKNGGLGRRPGSISPQQALAQYMNNHNYGADDFSIYSQDPQWRVLHKAAYPDAEIPALNSEIAKQLLSQYMATHNYGADDYAIYSKDPIWQELHSNAYPNSASPTRRNNIHTNSNGKITYNEFGVQSIESVANWVKEINPNPRNDPRRTVNCGKCAAAVFNRLNGDDTAVAGIGTYSISEMNKLTGRTQTTMTPDQIKNYLISQGPGSHAVVGVDRASGAGHWFNAYYDGHQVFTIEGQGGEIRGWPPDYGNVVHWDVSV